MTHYADDYVSKIMEPQKFCAFCNRRHGKLHADFEYRYLADVNIMYIKDMNNGNRSVTNDVDYVIWLLNSFRDLSRSKIVYEDSSGNFDGIATKNGKFDYFYPLNTRYYNMAIAAANIRSI